MATSNQPSADMGATLPAKKSYRVAKTRIGARTITGNFPAEPVPSFPCSRGGGGKGRSAASSRGDQSAFRAQGHCCARSRRQRTTRAGAHTGA